jgi:hypothetical protein
LGTPDHSFEKRQRKLAATKQRDQTRVKEKDAREAARAANQPAGERVPSEG